QLISCCSESDHSYRFFFFFSSRRRHTRWPRDWSSDVCSSDLDSADVWSRQQDFRMDASVGVPPDAFSETGQDWGFPAYRWIEVEIGRASCRERGVNTGGGGTLKKKKKDTKNEKEW